MVAPSTRSLGTVTSASTATPTFAEPAGAAADDIIVCGWFQDDARTSVGTPPTGFLPALDAPQANNPLTGSSPDHSLQVYLGRRSVVGAGPYAFTVVAGLGGATPFCEGRAVAVQDVPTSVVYPFTEAADGNTSGSSSSATAPAVSATSLDVDRYALYFATNWTGGAWTPPSGYGEDWDANNRIITLDHLTMPTAATTSPQAVCAGTDRTNAWVGIFPSSIAGSAPQVGQKASSRHPGRGPSSARFLQTPRSTEIAAVVSASGSGTASGRTSTTSSGIKGAAASGTASARTTTVEAGAKKAIGAGTSSARTSAVGSGVKGATGAGLPTARSTAAGSGVKKAAGTGAASVRTSATGAGVKKGAGGGSASTRTASAAAGIKKGAGSGASSARTSSAASGAPGSGAVEPGKRPLVTSRAPGRIVASSNTTAIVTSSARRPA